MTSPPGHRTTRNTREISRGVIRAGGERAIERPPRPRTDRFSGWRIRDCRRAIVARRLSPGAARVARRPTYSHSPTLLRSSHGSSHSLYNTLDRPSKGRYPMRISGSLARRYSTKSTHARTLAAVWFSSVGEEFRKHATRHDGEGFAERERGVHDRLRRLVGVHSHQNVARRQSTTHGIGHVPPKLRLDVFEPVEVFRGRRVFRGDGVRGGGSARRSTRRRPRRC